MNSTLKFGILGGILMGLTVSFNAFDINRALWTLLEVVILVLAIYSGVKEEKKNKHQNSIAYRDAIFTGLKINFIVALIHSAALFTYFNSNAKAVEQLKASSIEQAVSQMKELNYEKAVIKDHIEFIKREITPFKLAKNNFLIILVIGLVISLIVTAILRSKENDSVPGTGLPKAA